MAGQTGSRAFVRRHRRALFTAAAVVGSTYVLYRFVRSKVAELTRRASDELSARDNLRRRFEQNQKDCYLTVHALLPRLINAIVASMPVEALTQQIQARRGPSQRESQISQDSVSSSTPAARPGGGPSGGPSKLELWNELKIASLTRTLTCFYALSLLILLVRTQLNLVGRQNYVASVVDTVRATGAEIELRDETETGPGENDAAYECQRAYLSTSWWLLNCGWPRIRDRVRSAVEQVFDRVSPRDEMTAAQFRLLISRVRNRVETLETDPSVPFGFGGVLLPEPSEEQDLLAQIGFASGPVPEDFRRMMDETRDLLESPDAMRCMSRMLDSAVQLLVETRLAGTFSATAGGSVRLANVLAKVAGQPQSMIAADASLQPNERYVDVLDGVQELNAFAAVVYSSYYTESPIPEDAQSTQASPGVLAYASNTLAGLWH